MALELYYDYRLEELAERFADVVYNRKLNDLSAAALLKGQTVVVQTRGMAEFLRQYLAEKCCAAANLEMPFLNAFVNKTLTAIYGDKFKDAALRSDPEHMRFLIMQILSNKKYVQQELAGLYDYISGDNAELKRWQLAGAIAGVFDHYQLYRSCDKLPEMFRKAALSDNWQQRLYEQLFNSNTPGRDSFFKKFAQGDFDKNKCSLLPDEISVFGVGFMPPEYLNFFVNLAGYKKVNFFYLTPCMEYWENQESPKAVKKPAAWEVVESGNPVLQNLGRQGRSFFSCMMNCPEISRQMDPGAENTPNGYPANSTMLDVMQYDIRYLFDRREGAGDADFIGEECSKFNRDHSIAVHNCHSLRRQLEVLQDELLRIIKKGTDPGSIIVMTPDIAAAAPVIHAVFGNGDLRHVYSIADMPENSSAMALSTFKNILSAANSRFEYSNIMTLLDMPLISSLLNFTPGELARMGELLYQAGVRWGFDEQMRVKFCGNAFEEFSWQRAIDRLLAGFANRTTGGCESSIAGGSKVMDALENSDIEAFARLVKLLEKIEVLSRSVNDKKDIPAWCTLFESIMDDFFASGNSERTALAPMRTAVRKLRSAAFKGFLPGIYPLNAVVQMVEDCINNSAENGRFLRGKITFCRMMPMRSIPMDTVAILELDEGKFPRNKADLGFDLIPLLPQPGDRSLAAQDRYLLLEAIMAARKNLLFFYQGQDPRTGDEVPPCAPLSEIMVYLESAFKLKEYKHKVSGISEVYFTAGAEYPSFDRSNYKALKHLQDNLLWGENANVEPQEIASQLAAMYTPWQIKGLVTIDQLAYFFANPCSWFLKNRFNFKDSYNENEGQKWQKNQIADSVDDEMWSLNQLERYQINRLIMDMRNRDSNNDEIYFHAEKSNLLPPGRAGKEEFADIISSFSRLPDFWQEAFKSMDHLPVVYRSKDKDYCISGMVNISADQKYVLVFNWGSYKSVHALRALFGTLTAAASAAAENRSQKIGAKLLNLNSENIFEFRKIDPLETSQAIKLLDELIAVAGEKSDGPPVLFEKSSVYYKVPIKAEKKFLQGDFCDINQKSVSSFFTRASWNTAEFEEKFQYYAAKLYNLIEIDEDVENAAE